MWKNYGLRTADQYSKHYLRGTKLSIYHRRFLYCLTFALVQVFDFKACVEVVNHDELCLIVPCFYIHMGIWNIMTVLWLLKI